jgi:hypothetical protein
METVPSEKIINTTGYLSDLLPRRTDFNSVDSEIKETLIKRGWTEDKWNSVSEDER